MFYFVLFSSLTFIYNINSFTFYLYIVYFSIHFTIFFILLANLLFFIYNGINKIKGVNHMKKKKLKEFVILSLIFILIIACIILLILIIRDKYYLSQESIIYISDPLIQIISNGLVLFHHIIQYIRMAQYIIQNTVLHQILSTHLLKNLTL